MDEPADKRGRQIAITPTKLGRFSNSPSPNDQDNPSAQPVTQRSLPHRLEARAGKHQRYDSVTSHLHNSSAGSSLFESQFFPPEGVGPVAASDPAAYYLKMLPEAEHCALQGGEVSEREGMGELRGLVL